MSPIHLLNLFLLLGLLLNVIILNLSIFFKAERGQSLKKPYNIRRRGRKKILQAVSPCVLGIVISGCPCLLGGRTLVGMEPLQSTINLQTFAFVLVG